MNHYFEGVVLRKDVAAAGNSQAWLSECHECNTVFLHHNLVEQPTKSYKSECHSWIALNCCASQASLCLFLRLKCICQFRPDTPNFLPFLTIQLKAFNGKSIQKWMRYNCIEMLSIWVLRPGGGRGGRWASSQQSITSRPGNEDPRNGKVSLHWKQDNSTKPMCNTLCIHCVYKTS